MTVRELLDAVAAADARVKVLGFSRNFGHQAAITAGLDIAAGDAVVVMDADLQDPPELLPELVELYRQGFDVVSAQRVGRTGETAFKRATAGVFYGLMRRAVDPRLQPQVGDFRLLSRAAVTGLRGFREQHRFLRGPCGLARAQGGDRPLPPSAPRGGHDQVPHVEDGAVRLDRDLVVLCIAAQAMSGRRPGA